MEMKLCYRIWLDKNGKAFGAGPYKILANIEKYGSMNEAVKKMKMSYSKAWKLINMVEERLGFKVLCREVGGISGGGAYLTEEAKVFMEKYSSFYKEAGQALEVLYDKYFYESN